MSTKAKKKTNAKTAPKRVAAAKAKPKKASTPANGRTSRKIATARTSKPATHKPREELQPPKRPPARSSQRDQEVMPVRSVLSPAKQSVRNASMHGLPESAGAEPGKLYILEGTQKDLRNLGWTVCACAVVIGGLIWWLV